MPAKTIFVTDLGYGDAGKGSVIDWLAREYKNTSLVVRHNGGSQAAHNVVTPDGHHHTFSQFGSAAFLNIKTFLSRFMLVAPDNFMDESEQLNELGVETKLRVFVDGHAPITTPFHRAANRIKELIRSNGRHGSCGLGIQETVIDVLKHGGGMLYARDLEEPKITRKKLEFLRASKRLELEEQFDLNELSEKDESIAKEYNLLKNSSVVDTVCQKYNEFVKHVVICNANFLNGELAQDTTVLFEGAQGVLLDEDYAFFPYATRSKTTTVNAETLLNEAGYSGKPLKLGIVRSYGVRHGPGPFVTEDVLDLPDPHNAMNKWQREFRVGHFDAIATKYAAEATGGLDGLVVTCLDRVNKGKIATHYESCRDDMEPYFGLDNGKIGNIRIVRPPTLAYQEQLTSRLFSCKPVYKETDEPMENRIEREIGIPVLATSRGLTANEKKWRK